MKQYLNEALIEVASFKKNYRERNIGRAAAAAQHAAQTK
jgi:hypothetical protein